MNISTNASINTYADSDYYNHYNIKNSDDPNKTDSTNRPAPRKNARPVKTGNMQMDPTKMFPTNQPPTLLRVQPEMQCAPMRGSMYPMHIPKLHRTMEKSFPPPYPFILRSARNADAPMYPAVRQTQ